MNRIMKAGGVSAALAAAALFIAPSAAADHKDNRTRVSASISIGHGTHVSIGQRGAAFYKAQHRGRNYGYYDNRNLQRDAVRQCRRAIRDEGYSLGFRTVDFEGRRVRQVGPRGFVVRLNTEFEGRRREFERNVRCEVRRGRIVSLEGVPNPGRGHDRRRRYYGH